VDHPSLTAQTATKDSNIAYPVTGVRIVGNSGAGTATLTAIQAGGIV
jgi:predicted ABC-type transport system involved in lysophospholipase L1 biosynthesis ATPase subunit